MLKSIDGALEHLCMKDTESGSILQYSTVPLTGSSTVLFKLQRWPWQHSTIWSLEGGVLQVSVLCS